MLLSRVARTAAFLREKIHEIARSVDCCCTLPDRDYTVIRAGLRAIQQRGRKNEPR
jgi:hypothetical protein